jgi:peptide/nickel transport system substrate-binding protein
LRDRIGPTFVLRIVCLVFVFALAACQRQITGNELIILLEKKVPTFDPRKSSDSAVERLRQLLFNSLMRKGDNFEPVPDLAESVTVAPDYKTFTFKIRSGIKFHDGKSLSALDVKYTFETMMSRADLTKRASFTQDLATVEAPDPQTVVFRCKNPFPSLPGDIIPIGIIPEGSSDQQDKKPVGTGPFRFISHTDEQEIVLSAYDQYFEGRPTVDGIRVKIVPDNSTRESELRKGSVDLALNADLEPVTVEALQKVSDLKVQIADGTNLAHLGLNLLDPVLKDVRVRQALAYAIDREAIIRDVLRGQGKAANSLLPVKQAAYEPEVRAYAYDLAKAQELLDQAGYKRNGDQPRFKLTLKTSTLSFARKVGETLQDQLRRAGVNLELQSLENQKLTQDLTDGSFQLYFRILVGGNQSTDMFRYAYHSKSIPPNGQNRFRYNNPPMDKLLDEVLLAAPERRKAIFSQVQKTLAEELPAIYLWYSASIVIANQRVTNLTMDPSGDWRVLRQVRLQN